MKKFTSVLVFVLPIVAFILIMLNASGEWLNSVSYMYGHEITAVITNKVAVMFAVGPLVVTLSYTLSVFTHKFKIA